MSPSDGIKACLQCPPTKCAPSYLYSETPCCQTSSTHCSTEGWQSLFLIRFQSIKKIKFSDAATLCHCHHNCHSQLSPSSEGRGSSECERGAKEGGEQACSSCKRDTPSENCSKHSQGEEPCDVLQWPEQDQRTAHGVGAGWNVHIWKFIQTPDIFSLSIPHLLIFYSSSNLYIIDFLRWVRLGHPMTRPMSTSWKWVISPLVGGAKTKRMQKPKLQRTWCSSLRIFPRWSICQEFLLFICNFSFKGCQAGLGPRLGWWVRVGRSFGLWRLYWTTLSASLFSFGLDSQWRHG